NKTLYLKRTSGASADQEIDVNADGKDSNTLTLDMLNTFMNTIGPSHIENAQSHHSENLAARVTSLETMNIGTHVSETSSVKSSTKPSGKTGFRFKSKPADESLSLPNLVSLREQSSNLEDSKKP